MSKIIQFGASGISLNSESLIKKKWKKNANMLLRKDCLIIGRMKLLGHIWEDCWRIQSKRRRCLWIQMLRGCILEICNGSKISWLNGPKENMAMEKKLNLIWKKVDSREIDSSIIPLPTISFLKALLTKQLLNLIWHKMQTQFDISSGSGAKTY